MKKRDILKAGGVCALSILLMTGCGEKKEDTKSNSNSNSNQVVQSNSNSNTSNSNSNSNSNVKLSDTEALTTGKALYKKAITNYPSPLSGALESKCKSMGNDKNGKTSYDCTTLYNELKIIYTENNEIFKNFTTKDGKNVFSAGGIGFSGKTTTTLSVKSNTEDKIVFEASTEVYNESSKSSDTSKNDFVIVKENGSWKISSYNYVLGSKASDEVK